MGNVTSYFYSGSTQTDPKQEINDLRTTVTEQAYLIECLRNRLHAEETINDKPDFKNIKNVIQETKKKRDYEYLAFSGGGIKGICFCGALDVLEKEGVLKNIKGYAGSSAGSIVASLLAIGYTPEELKEILRNLKMKDVLTDATWLVTDAINFVERFGACEGKYIYDYLGKLIEMKTGNADYSIQDLWDDKKIELIVTGTNMNRQKTVYFYHDTKLSKIPIRRAIRLSMSIPFAFVPVEEDGDLYVDGGVLDNFPLHVFDGEYPGDIKARLNLTDPNPKVLGVKIMTTDDVVSYSVRKRENLNSLFNFSCTFIDAFCADEARRIMTPSYWLRTITVVTPDYPLTDFDLTADQKEQLIKDGTKYAEEFFKD